LINTYDANISDFTSDFRKKMEILHNFTRIYFLFANGIFSRTESALNIVEVCGSEKQSNFAKYFFWFLLRILFFTFYNEFLLFL